MVTRLVRSSGRLGDAGAPGQAFPRSVGTRECALPRFTKRRRRGYKPRRASDQTFQSYRPPIPMLEYWISLSMWRLPKMKTKCLLVATSLGARRIIGHRSRTGFVIPSETFCALSRALGCGMKRKRRGCKPRRASEGRQIIGQESRTTRLPTDPHA